MNTIRSLMNVHRIVSAIIVSLAVSSPAADTVTDADGNVYATVTIGNQVWTVENLKTTKYNDGAPVALVADSSEWSRYDAKRKPACCWYGNDTANKKTYGALYNWYAISTGRLAPKGWHVATEAEWMRLEIYLSDNGHNLDETKEDRLIAKSMAATTEWAWGSGHGDPAAIGTDPTKNNRSGFSALPGGFRLVSGNYRNIGTTGRWWTASEYDATNAWRFNLRYDSGNLNRDRYLKGCGFSVRLVKD